jgi:methyl-accepting chemotaxis protein
MALDPKLVKQLKKDLEEINKIYEKIGEKPLTVDFQTVGVDDIKLIKDYLSEARTFVTDLEDGFGGMVISVKNIVSEWDKGFNKPTKEATSSFSKLKGIAEKLSNDFKGISELRGKEVKSLEKSARLEVERLKLLTAELNNRKDLNEEEEALLANLNSEFKIQNDILKGVKGRLEYEEKIQKTLGYTGVLFGGLQKTLEKIGIESEAFEHLNDDLREAAKTGEGFSVVGAGLKSMFHGIKESLADPLVQVTLTIEAFHELYKIGTDFSKKTFDIQTNLGLSYKASEGITKNLEHMVVDSGDIADNTLRAFANFNDLVTSTKELNDYYGTSVEFSVDQLAIQAKLQEVAGLTTEEASKLDAYSASTGKNAEQLYNSIGKVNKGVFSQKKITQEVLKTSGQLAAQYKNNPDLIAKAVVQAQRLGMTLEQTKNISKNLLNFEDSISAELEAELLTGEDLNLERARGLALQGKTAEAAEELMKNLGPNGLQKFQKIRIQ